MLLHCEDVQHFRLHADVQVSPQFLAWVFSLGSGAEIVFPPAVVDQMKEMVQTASQMFAKSKA